MQQGLPARALGEASTSAPAASRPGRWSRARGTPAAPSRAPAWAHAPACALWHDGLARACQHQGQQPLQRRWGSKAGAFRLRRGALLAARSSAAASLGGSDDAGSRDALPGFRLPERALQDGASSSSRSPPGADQAAAAGEQQHQTSEEQQQQQQQPSQQGEWRLLPMVPWGTGKIVQVMVLWLLAYIIIGHVAVPVGLSLLGLDRDELGLRGHAVLHLCLDLSQLVFTLLILWHCLKQYKPRQKGFFPIKWRGWWPLVVLGACLVFPLVDWLAQQSLTWFPVDGDGWGSHMEASLSVGDWITNVAYFSVVSICAPVWEEAIFRGFLLTSLARYMSPPWAVATSSLLFAMCHFRLQTFLPLLVLGVVFSVVYLSTRNLLPPMVLHSAWNVFVLANLLLKTGGAV